MANQAELLAKLDPSWNLYKFNGNIPSLILEWQASGNNNDFTLYPHFNVDDKDYVIFSTKQKKLEDFTPSASLLSQVTPLVR
jgi:hypothetical protein